MVADCSLLRIQRPSQHQQDFFNGRKKRHAVNIFTCCDWRGATTLVSAAYPGAQHDSTCYRQTELFANWQQFMSVGETILADSGFKGCGLHHVVPRPCNGSLSLQQQQENARIKRHRVIVEFSYGFIKYKWRILAGVWMWHPLDKAATVFTLAAQLCNRIMRHRGYLRGAAYASRRSMEQWEQLLAVKLPQQQWDGQQLDEVLGSGDAQQLYHAAPSERLG
jgi:hypothetical protein